jgi:hypothetical protein
MTDHDHETAPPGRVRNIATLFLEDGTGIAISHLYPPELQECPDCGSSYVSAGLVGMTVDDPESAMTPEEALLLANRLTRAANFVLEMMEDPPDIEREAARAGSGDIPDYPPAS